MNESYACSRHNDAHHHSGPSYLTPADVQYGRAATILEIRRHKRPHRIPRNDDPSPRTIRVG